MISFPPPHDEKKLMKILFWGVVILAIFFFFLKTLSLSLQATSRRCLSTKLLRFVYSKEKGLHSVCGRRAPFLVLAR